MKGCHELMLGRAEPGREVPRGHGWIMRELIGKLRTPRREKTSIVSLKFYCALAEPYALLVWAAPAGSTLASY